MAHIGERLREVRERAGMSQRGLATRLGVSYPLACRWEAGDRTPPYTDILKMAEIFEIDPRELLRDVDALTIHVSDMESIKLVQAFTQLSPFFRKRFLDFVDHFVDIAREAESQHGPAVRETSVTS